MASSNSPCAACKFLRRKCTQGCVFAPYFPPDQPTKFANVHRVFGASNVAKLLNDINPVQREDAVNSLAYEAEARLQDPIYGCVGHISVLQHKLKSLQHELYNAKKELSTYIGPSALGSFIPHPHPHLQVASGPSMPPFGIPGMGMGIGMGMGLGLMASAAAPLHPQLLMREQYHQQQQQMMEAQAAQQMAVAAAREQELLRSFEQQQQQQQQLDFVRLNSGFDGHRGFSQVGGPSVAVAAAPPASALSLVPPQQSFENMFLVQQQYQEPPQHHQHQHQRAGSDDGRSGIGPSS